jgi:hypothetical protein
MEDPDRDFRVITGPLLEREGCKLDVWDIPLMDPSNRKSEKEKRKKKKAKGPGPLGTR